MQNATTEVACCDDNNMQMNNKLYVLVLVMAISTLPLFAQEKLTLEEAITIGLENNLSIKIARNNQEILANDVTLGNAGFLPTLDLVGTQNFGLENSEFVFQSGDQQVTRNADSRNLTIEPFLNWTVFDGLRMFVTKDKLEEIRRQGRDSTRSQIENIITDIYTSYYQVILEDEKRRVLESTLEISEQRVDISQAQYEIGSGTKQEYLAAQVDYNADASALIQQEELSYNAKIDLNRLLNRDLETTFEVESDIPVNENLDIEELREILFQSNAHLEAVRRGRNIAALETKELQAERWPQISIYSGYNILRTYSEAGFVLQNVTNRFNYGITASVNIFDGFNQSRVVQNARIREKSSEWAIDEITIRLNADLNKRFINYKNSLRLYDLETNNLRLARENENISLERYKLGRATFLELREAQRSAVEAESRQIDAAYSVVSAEIELKRISGRLLQERPEL